MMLSEALEFSLPRRRSTFASWEDEQLYYSVGDILADDWELLFPNGRIIDEYDYACQYADEYSDKPVGKLTLVQGGKGNGENSGSSGSA